MRPYMLSNTRQHSYLGSSVISGNFIPNLAMAFVKVLNLFLQYIC